MGYAGVSRQKTYRKKRQYRKPKAKGGSWMNTIKDVAGVASTAITIAKSVAALVNVEKKYVQTNLLDYNVDNTTLAGGCLNLIAEGDDYTMRNGRSIKLTNLNMRINLYQQASSVRNIFRLIVVRDLGAQGAQPAGSNLIDSTLYSTDNAPLAYRNYDSTAFKRYQVLHDQRYALDAQHPQQVIELNLAINKHAYYIDTTSNILSVGSGAIFYYLISQGATANGTGTQIDMTSRLYFIDN